MRAPSPRRPSGGAERYDGAVITAGVRVVLGSDDSMYKPCGLNFSLISLYYKSAPRAKRRQTAPNPAPKSRVSFPFKRGLAFSNTLRNLRTHDLQLPRPQGLCRSEERR